MFIWTDMNENSVIMQISGFQIFWFQAYFTVLKIIEDPKELFLVAYVHWLYHISNQNWQTA